MNGKPIEKLLIEGDDLFDDKYKLLSKNLDANTIEEVQILNNFEENPVLKSFQESEKVALNLILKEDKKNVWFGNVDIGLGTNKHYDNSSNIGLLKKKIKFFNLTNYNNIGNVATSQVKNNGLINITGFQTTKKIEKQNTEIVNIDNLTPSNFSKNEDIFNNSFLNSLSFTTNLSKKTKLRNLTYYTFDKINKQNSHTIQYFIEPEVIKYSEKNSINIKDISFATEFELKHFSNNQTYFTYDFSFENNPIQKNGDLIFNNDLIFQKQNNKEYNFFNHLNITKKLTKNKLLLLYSYLGINNAKQSYIVQPDRFQNNEVSSSVQNSNTPLNYYGFYVEVINKIKKSQYNVEFATTMDKDKINSIFRVNNQLDIDSLFNNTVYRNLKLNLTGKYSYKISPKTELKTSIIFSQNFVNLNNQSKKLFFINPLIRLSISKTVLGNFGFSYGFKNNLLESQYLNENYIRLNYRTFSRGLKEINQTGHHNLVFYYTFNNYKKQFLINSYLSYNISNKSLSSKNLINENFNINQFIITDDRRNTNYNLGITRYSKKLSTSFKFSTTQNWSEYPLTINGVNSKSNNYNASYRVQGTTYFKFFLNFKFFLLYNYSKGDFNNQTTTNDYIEGYLNTVLKLSKQWLIQSSNNYYLINKKYYLFTNMMVHFNPKDSRFSYRLTGSNLLNLNEFSDVYISEFQRNESRYRVLPRYFLLNIRYRF